MFPGGDQLARPPVQPPEMPSLSGMLPNEEVSQGDSSGLARLVFRIEQMLDSVAAAAPNGAQTVDEIKGLLRDLMTSVKDGGAHGKPSLVDTGSTDLEPY